MGKVGVARSIARGYGFAVGHLIGILGTSWLPAAFFAGLCAWWIGALGGEAHMLTGGALPRAAAQTLLFLLGSSLLLSTIAVPLTRTALGEEREGSLAHFVIGRREFRLFLGSLRFLGLVLAALMIFAVAFTLAVQGGLVHLIATTLPGPKGFSTSLPARCGVGFPLRRAVADAGLATMLIAVAVIALRFGFFLGPLAAADERAGLSRAAQLSGRNFWRLLAVSATIVLPIAAIAGSLSYLVVGPSARASIAHAYGAGALEDLVAIIGAQAVPLAIVIAGSGPCSCWLSPQVRAQTLIAIGSKAAKKKRCTKSPPPINATPARASKTQASCPRSHSRIRSRRCFPKRLSRPRYMSRPHQWYTNRSPRNWHHRRSFREVAAPIDQMVDVVPELTTPIEERQRR